jgi:hypothetical protein
VLRYAVALGKPEARSGMEEVEKWELGLLDATACPEPTRCVPKHGYTHGSRSRKTKEALCFVKTVRFSLARSSFLVFFLSFFLVVPFHRYPDLARRGGTRMDRVTWTWSTARFLACYSVTCVRRSGVYKTSRMEYKSTTITSQLWYSIFCLHTRGRYITCSVHSE